MPKKLPKWASMLLTIVAVVVAVKVAWGLAYPSGTWRYKLTVEVQTPEGVKTGSAVREVSGSYSLRLLGEAYALHLGLIKGEAVVVDMGERGRIFALNRTYKDGMGGGFSIVMDAFPYAAKKQSDIIRYYSHLQTDEVVSLKEAQYPVMVRFRDAQDPKTVELVKPDDFASIFGEGVSLKSVTIEMTDEPVTIGVVEKYLPWIYSIKSNLDGTNYTFSKELSNNLDWGDFVRGKK